MSKTFSKVVFISPWYHDDDSEAPRPFQIPWFPSGTSGEPRLFTDATGEILYIDVGHLSPAEARDRVAKCVAQFVHQEPIS
jgi:hypothetical protein